MIIDAFTYFNEADILEFRLKLLWDYVDKFVIVEADHTFSGKIKLFNLDGDRFAWAKEKIVYHQFLTPRIWSGDEPPTIYDPTHPCWYVEKDQRNAIIDACKGFSDEDMLIIGDVDEIPSREVIEHLGKSLGHDAVVCRQLFFYYNLTNLRKENWHGTIFTKLGNARKIGTQALRDQRNSLPFVCPGGVHMSYFGGNEAIRKKIESFSHQEYNTDEFKDGAHINICLDTGADIFKRDIGSQKVGPDFFPEYFSKLAKNYPQWGL